MMKPTLLVALFGFWIAAPPRLHAQQDNFLPLPAATPFLYLPFNLQNFTENNNRVVPGDSLFEAFRQTPFVSIRGDAGCGDDSALFVADFSDRRRKEPLVIQPMAEADGRVKTAGVTRGVVGYLVMTGDRHIYLFLQQLRRSGSTGWGLTRCFLLQAPSNAGFRRKSVLYAYGHIEIETWCTSFGDQESAPWYRRRLRIDAHNQVQLRDPAKDEPDQSIRFSTATSFAISPVASLSIKESERQDVNFVFELRNEGNVDLKMKDLVTSGPAGGNYDIEYRVCYLFQSDNEMTRSVRVFNFRAALAGLVSLAENLFDQEQSNSTVVKIK